MAVNLLHDVDVLAISIVKNGANRKRFYLRKQHDGEPNLTATDKIIAHRLVKADDWTTVYCVVAEPGNLENAGIADGAGTGIDDMWLNEDEIRKASHKFMANGGLVNRMHETLDPYGAIVENFIAQADFTVGDETIKKGSWVIGLHPTDEGRQRIEAGEFTGVSIQGTGLRTLMEKDASATQGDSKACPSCGGTVAADRKTCQNCSHSFAKVLGPPGTDIARNQAAKRGPLKNLISFYMKKRHPFRACVRDNTKRFGPDGANRVCATLKDLGMNTTHWRHGNNKNLKKASLEEIGDTLPAELVQAMEDNWYASGLTDEDATLALNMALETEDRNLLQKLADHLGLTTDADDDTHEEEDVPLTDEQTAALEKVGTLETQVTDLTKEDGRLAGIERALAEIKDSLKPEPTADEKKAELEQNVAKLAQDLQKAQEDLAAIAQGSSSQGPVEVSKGNDNDPDSALASALFG